MTDSVDIINLCGILKEGDFMLEHIINIDSNCKTVKMFDELLDEMIINYQNRLENMKNEIKQLEREIEDEKARVGEDVYNQKILSVLIAENDSSNQK